MCGKNGRLETPACGSTTPIFKNTRTKSYASCNVMAAGGSIWFLVQTEQHARSNLVTVTNVSDGAPYLS